MDIAHVSWPFFEPRHSQTATAFDQWAATHLTSFEQDEGGDGRAARQIFELLGRSGWLRETVAADCASDGSLPIDLRKVCILREVCAHSSAIADVALSEPWLGILPIALYGSRALRDAYLPGYVSGEILPAFALSEPGAGSDAAAITTTARRDGQDYVINGRKTWTSNAGLADVYIVFAQVEDGGDAGGIAAFAVDGHAQGISIEERLCVLPPHSVGTWSLSDCRVPADRCIGEPGEGLAIAMRVLEVFRPTVGAATLGFARRAMAEALQHSTDRTAFRKPIFEHQLIQAKISDMAVSIDAAALLVYRAAWQHDAGDQSIARTAAMAKLYSTEAAFGVIDEAVQIFGGLGIVRGTLVERLFRHSRAFRIFDGTSEIQRLIIARNVLGGR